MRLSDAPYCEVLYIQLLQAKVAAVPSLGDDHRPAFDKLAPSIEHL